MRILRIIIITTFSSILLLGCKKDNASQQCQSLKNGMVANNVEEVKNIITGFINQLPSKTYSEENINNLVSVISGQCGLSAALSCFSCIDTLPEQTEIIINYTVSGISTNKVIDISYSPSDHNMKVLNMHD